MSVLLVLFLANLIYIDSISLSCRGNECVNTTKTCSSSQRVCQIICPIKDSCKNLYVLSESITTTISCNGEYSCNNITIECGLNVESCRLTAGPNYGFIDSSLKCSINSSLRTDNNKFCTLQCINPFSCISTKYYCNNNNIFDNQCKCLFQYQLNDDEITKCDTNKEITYYASNNMSSTTMYLTTTSDKETNDDNDDDKKKELQNRIALIVVGVIIFIGFILVFLYIGYLKKKKKINNDMYKQLSGFDILDNSQNNGDNKDDSLVHYQL